jgi:hypothetical protein
MTAQAAVVYETPAATVVVTAAVQGPAGTAVTVSGTGLVWAQGGVIQPTALGGTNGQMLWWLGGVPTWAAPPASGILQLTQDVLAGPGSGSEAATVVQITGSAGVCSVVNGTDLKFQTTGLVPSSDARLNFVSGETAIGFRNQAGTADLPALSFNNTGTNDNLVLGSTAGSYLQINLVGGVGNMSLNAPSGAGINLSAPNASIGLNFGGTGQINAVGNLGITFQSNSVFQFNRGSVDAGGSVGAISLATVTTMPTALPVGASVLLYADQTGQCLGIGGNGIRFPTFISGPLLTQNSTGTATQGANFTITPQQSTQATNQGGGNLIVNLQAPIGTGTEAHFQIQRGGVLFFDVGTDPGHSLKNIWLNVTPTTANNWIAQSDGNYIDLNAPSSSSTIFLTGGNGPVAAEFAFGSSAARIGAAGWNVQLLQIADDYGGGVGVVSLGPVTTTPTTLPSGGSVGLWTTAAQRLGINGQGILFGAGVTALVQIGGTAPAAVSAGNGTAAQNFSYQGMVGGATSATAATGGAAGNVTITSPAGGNATGTGATTGGSGGDLILNAGAGGTGNTAGAGGLLRLRLAGSDQGVLEPNGFRFFDTNANDFGGGTGVLSIGAVTTTPTALLTSGAALYATSGNRIGMVSTGIAWAAGIISTITMQQAQFASTSSANGAAGNELDVLAQVGQNATGAHTGGSGGVGKFSGAAGGTSDGTSGATAGGGGIGYFGGGNGGNCTAGTGNGGAGADGILFSGNGGTSSGGTAGANGLVRMRIGGQLVGADYVIVGAHGLDMATGGSTTQTIAATGNTTLAASVYAFPIIRINAITLTGAATITFPNTPGCWFVDISQVAALNLTLAFKSGTATSPTISALGSAELVMVVTYGSNTISINQ